MSQIQAKLIDAISRRYSFIQANTRYQLIREYNVPTIGYVYVGDKHIATINYENEYIQSIYVATNWETTTIKNTLNSILRHFTKNYIYQKNYIWYWNTDWEVITADNLVYTNAVIENWCNSENGIEWRKLMSVD